ncbi:MAG TPA: exodeoxyribonuclease VII large subunit, partial [Burkholderiaceae bacterium]|nr:exodeoxyribonuclease VII large subunit [Burkholderiaceae bacterium]
QQRTDWAQRVLAGPRPLHGLGRRIAELRARLDGGFARATGRARATLAARAQAHLRTRPRADALGARVARQARALETATRQALTSRAARLAALRQAFDHLDPRAVLERGYSIVRDADGHVVRDARDIVLQAELHVTFAVGSARARVESKDDRSGG